MTCGLLSDWRVTLQPLLERRCPPSPSSSSWTARVHPNQHPGELHAIPCHISSMLQAQNHWCNRAVSYFHSYVTKLISTGVTYGFLTVSCVTWTRISQGRFAICQWDKKCPLLTLVFHIFVVWNLVLMTHKRFASIQCVWVSCSH